MSLIHGEYRRHSRTDIRTSVSVGLQGNELDTKTLDVSEGGLALNKPGALNLAIGQSVNVTFNRMPNLTVPARIVRTSEHSIGLELDHFNFSTDDIDGIVRTAPLFERLRSKSKRAVWKFMRQSVVLATNTLFRKLLLVAVKPTFLFAVYGNEKDVGTYMTPRMSKVIPPILLAGVIKNQGHRGLMVASKFYEHELAEDSDKVNQYLKQLQDEFSHIKTIALVGRLPNFVMKAGNEIKP
ncbi:MAG: PilZ domain-containing protein, partial [Pseudomonadales bacterium]|nr:PilZ domain-containing protein [Pseudomonadales bacterium]